MRIYALILGFLPLGAWASNVLELDTSNFSDFVGAGKPPALVEFYAPWCGHCKNLAPTYEQLGDAFSHAKDKVSIIKVDADGKGKDLGQKYGVTGFPTLKWFPAGGVEPEAYTGARELDDLVDFVSSKSGVKSSLKPPLPSAIVQVDVDNFKSVVMDPSKDVLVAFTAPWCGHCKNMKPILEKVAQNFQDEKNCIIANYNADAAQNREIAKEYSVTGYPTLKFFPRASSPFASAPRPADTISQKAFDKYGKHPIPYESSRTEEDFTEFLNEHCGTFRQAGGGLNFKAGRLGAFDEWAASLMSFVQGTEKVVAEDSKAKMDEIIGLMKAGIQEVKKEEELAAKWYVRASEKIVNGGETWLDKEANRLRSLIGTKQLAPQKLDEIKVKLNILGAFVAKKVEDVKQKTRDEL